MLSSIFEIHGIVKCNFNQKVGLCIKRFWGTVHRCILPVFIIVLLTAKLPQLNTKIFQSKYFFCSRWDLVKASWGQIVSFCFISLELPIADSVSDQ